MESYTNATEDHLIDSLSFKLKPGASYILDRRSVTYFPQGGNRFESQSGAKVIKISMTGKEWLDPDIRIMFDLVNDDTTNNLHTLSGPWSFFRRIRLISGSVIEDIDYYARTHDIWNALRSKDNRLDTATQSFGDIYDVQASLTVNESYNDGILTKNTVLFKPLLGLFNQEKLIPLAYLGSGLTIELELIDNKTDPIIVHPNKSIDWHIENVCIKADVITLDSQLSSQYDKLLVEDNKDFPIHYTTIISQIQSIMNQTEAFVNVSRSCTRLKSVYVTLIKEDLSYITDETKRYGRKNWNTFFSPASYDQTFNNKLTIEHYGEFEMQLSIGNKMYPEYPIRSHQEAFYYLTKLLNVSSSAYHGIDINARNYRDNKLIIGINTQKSADQASFTGMDLRSSDLINVKFKYSNTHASRIADRMHIILCCDNIMKISSSGIQIYD